MNQKLKRKWVQALLSGDYKQGRKLLLNPRGQYCCLGVLGEITGTSKEFLMNREWLNASALDGEIEDELAEVNDAGVPFEMIAGLIDEAL